MFKITNTSNKDILKFESQSPITKGSFEYSIESNDDSSPLASQLLQLPFITKVYITANFIALQKIDLIDWIDVQTELKLVIDDYFKSGNPLFKAELNPVEVYAEGTPNPEVMKFVTNKLILKGDVDFKSKKQAEAYPFIASLFDLNFAKSVFVENNYISITKNPDAIWEELIHPIRDYIKQHFATLIMPKKDSDESNVINQAELDQTSKDIISILDEYIKPAVMADGGNIIFDSYDEATKSVKVILKGACNGCPSSTITLKNGIETTLKNMLPNKIEQVEAL